MSVLKFISVDPSLSNTAVVYGTIIGEVIPEGYFLLHTDPPKKGEKKINSIVSRAKYILDELRDFVNKFNPDVCFAELPTGSQSSSASISVGVSCCIIATLGDKTVSVTASDVKMNSVGSKTATKKEIMGYCENKYPNFMFERKKDGSMVEGRMEHVCDAICIAEVGFKTMII